jgi:molybdopterin-guanine dinucleotide biosynthesis protein A
MGQDKAALLWRGVSLLDHMTSLLSTVAGEVRVVGRGAFPDQVLGKGPLGGILTALRSTDKEANIILAVDLPLLTPDFLTQFHGRFLESSKPLLACRIDSRFPLCLGIRPALQTNLEERIEAGKLDVHSFIGSSNPEILEHDDLRKLGADPSIFENLNTPEDWIRLR